MNFKQRNEGIVGKFAFNSDIRQKHSRQIRIEEVSTEL